MPSVRAGPPVDVGLFETLSTPVKRPQLVAEKLRETVLSWFLRRRSGLAWDGTDSFLQRVQADSKGFNEEIL